MEGARVLRVGALVVACTLVLTATFVGVLALVSDGTPGLGARLPVYVLTMAGSFVAALVIAEQRRSDGGTVIVTAGTLALAVFVVVALAGEGAVYAQAHPGRVFESSLLLYLFAAGLIGSGLAYWAVRHWREFAGRSRQVGL
jgi:hypothetical protein